MDESTLGRSAPQGILTYSSRSRTATFPMVEAEFGVLAYVDSFEIWVSIQAGKDSSGANHDPDFDWEPRLYATIERAELNPNSDANSGVSSLTLQIPRDFDARATANLHYFADYGEPESLGPCTIEIEPAPSEFHSAHDPQSKYHVRWQAQLDFYGGTQPEDVIDIEINGDIHFAGIRKIACTTQYARSQSMDRLFLICLPLGSAVGATFGMATDWFSWWVGILIGGFAGLAVATQLESRRQRRVHRLLQGMPEQS